MIKDNKIVYLSDLDFIVRYGILDDFKHSQNLPLTCSALSFTDSIIDCMSDESLKKIYYKMSEHLNDKTCDRHFFNLDVEKAWLTMYGAIENKIRHLIPQF